MKYVKKPIPIDAVRWTGYNHMEIEKFMSDVHPIFTGDNEVIIHTLEGDMHAPPGSYIIRGAIGEYYPCRGDVFEQTYEPYKPKYVRTIKCPKCGDTIKINVPHVLYDELNKEYRYWDFCPSCKKRMEWSVNYVSD